MERREFVKWLGFGFASMTLPAVAGAGAKGGDKPNILFIFADDQCHDALSALGSEAQTPHLDRLAARGVTFTNCYNQGAWHGAVCVASRTMLNSGRFLWNAKALEPNLNAEREAGRLWSQQMAAAGYDTYFAGKWHVKTKAAGAFQTTKNVRPGMPNQTKEGYNRPIEGEPDKWSPYDEKFQGYWKGGKHWSEVLGDDAVEFLGQAAGEKNPFFMYLAFNAPHDPRQSPKEYVDRYPLDEIEMPGNFLPEYPYKDAIGCSAKLRDEKLAPFPRTEYAVKKNRQEYFAIISHMDAQIGRMLDALEKTGKAENTYIFFTADHGLAVGQHGLLGKQNMFEHSMKPPMIVCGPDIPRGKPIAAPVYLQDIMPTALELAGAEVPGHVQFRSLLPLIAGERMIQYDAIYGAYCDLQRMVRQGRHKLIHYPKAKKTLLFDLTTDPLENKDLTGDPRHAGVLEALKAKLIALQEEMGDTLKIDWSE